MRICVLSDLHGNLIDNIEPCELVLICGDVSPLKYQRSLPSIDGWLKKRFAEWVNNLPCEKVYMVAGNHDIAFEGRSSIWKLECITYPTDGKLVLLENEYADYLSIGGKVYRIFGTPFCHKFGNWAFMYEDEYIYQQLNEKMPENCDVVISHDAPYGTSDICFGATWHTLDEHIGCRPLRNIVIEKKPKYLFHGHLHTSNHNEEILENTKVYNTSILDESYSITFDPLYLDI